MGYLNPSGSFTATFKKVIGYSELPKMCVFWRSRIPNKSTVGHDPSLIRLLSIMKRFLVGRYMLWLQATSLLIIVNLPKWSQFTFSTSVKKQELLPFAVLTFPNFKIIIFCNFLDIYILVNLKPLNRPDAYVFQWGSLQLYIYLLFSILFILFLSLIFKVYGRPRGCASFSVTFPLHSHRDLECIYTPSHDFIVTLL